ncbi:MAG TPA: hypothetical protein VFR31_14660 [Thermoanaerobaculia bacterium]|nr:hypothetical protein [Thermoanaerobaculia bacterium]
MAIAPLRAQDTAQPTQQSLSSVTINLLTGTVASDLPFDEPFLLTGSVPKDALVVEVRYLSHPRDIRVVENDNNTLCVNARPSVALDSRECRTRRRACERNPEARPDGVPCFSCIEKRKKGDKGVNSTTPWSQDNPRRFVANPIDCPAWEPAGRPLTWRYPDLEWDATSDPPDQNRKFVVTVPALEAERYYSFHLSLHTSSQDAELEAKAQALRTKAADLFLSELREIPDDAQITEREKCLTGAADAPGSCRDLPGELCTTLLELEQAEGAEFDPGSLCAADGTVRPPLELQGQIEDLAQAREQQIDALDDRQTNQRRFETWLAELHMQLAPLPNGSRPSLDKLFAALDDLSAESNADGARAKRILESLQAGRSVIEAPDGVRANLALGCPAANPCLTDDSRIATDPAFAASLAQGYEQTARDLKGLEDGLTELISGVQRLLVDRRIASPANQGLAPADRLTASDLTGPKGTVETAVVLLKTARQLAFSLGQDVSRVAGALEQQKAIALDIAGRIVLARLDTSFVIDGRAFSAFQTQQANYISADLAVVFAPELSEVVPALGVNLYLRPINKNVPLRLKGGFMRRFAFTFGVTASGIADGGGTPPTQGTREDLVNSHSLLLGGGYRLSGSTRLTGGAIVFYELDPNPLKDDRSVSYSPFIALSFDWDVAKLFRGALQQLGLPNT